MLVKDILATQTPTFSFEFFPPKKEEGWDKLFKSIAKLRILNPSYVSVTYGSGGSTRKNTHKLVTRIQDEVGITVVSHLTVVGSEEREIMDILSLYEQQGVQNVLALRGDPPKDMPEWKFSNSPFRHAKDLVVFIKQRFPRMCLGVAGFPEGHPDTPNRLKEMDYLKEKVDAGADYIVTQLFFDNHDFFDYRERCILAGIKIPIIAGIMPITSRPSMQRMAELAGGSRIPAKLLKTIYKLEKKEDVEKAGTAWAIGQVSELVQQDVQGVHFYTLNNASSTINIYQGLDLPNASNEISMPKRVF